MAEEEKKEEKQEEKPKQEAEKESAKQGEGKSEDKETKVGGFKLMTWLIPAGIVIAGLTGGFGLAQLLAGGSNQPEIPEVQVEDTKSFDDLLADSTSEKKAWPFDIEPVIANLDEPGVTRYARVAVTLELSGEMDSEAGTAFLEEKKAVLRDWLTTYIAGLSLERVRGTSNLARIKKEIRDQFNELVFPESKPFIVNILFKEFAIQ